MPRLKAACPIAVGCLLLVGGVLPITASPQLVEGQILEAEAYRPVAGAFIEPAAGADASVVWAGIR